MYIFVKCNDFFSKKWQILVALFSNCKLIMRKLIEGILYLFVLTEKNKITKQYLFWFISKIFCHLFQYFFFVCVVLYLFYFIDIENNLEISNFF